MNNLDRRPICLLCKCNFQTERASVVVRLCDNAVTQADLYKCPSCGVQIVAGVGVGSGEGTERYDALAKVLGEDRIVYVYREVYL